MPAPKDHDRDHRYAQRRNEGQDPVQGQDYGDLRGPDPQNPDQAIQGGEDHSYGGYGTDMARRREEFGGGTAEPEVDRYAPGTPPGKGSGVGALGQGGGAKRPGPDGMLAPDEHPGIVQPDGDVRRPD